MKKKALPAEGKNPRARKSNGSFPPPRKGQSRTQTARLMRIEEILKEGNFPSAPKLAKRLEVSDRTIRTDIQYMIDMLDRPIAYDRSKHGFYFTEPVGAFPTIRVSESEAFWIMMAEFAFESFPGLAQSVPVQSAIAKLTGPVMKEFTLSRKELANLISFRPGGPVVEVDENILPTVVEALLGSREIAMQYRGRHQSQATRRVVQPLHLRWGESACYLLCRDAESLKHRTFALSRMREVRISDRTFQRPKDFDPTEHLANGIGIFNGGDLEDVRIRFTGGAAFLVAERMWHPSQKITPCGEKCVELEMRVAGNPEFDRWVLGWGSEAQVLAPESLRKRMRQHATRMLAALDAAEKEGGCADV